MELFIIYGVIHLICAFISYGLMFAYWQRAFPLVANREYSKDVKECLLTSLAGGPIMLLASLSFLSDKKESTRTGGNPFKFGFKLW